MAAPSSLQSVAKDTRWAAAARRLCRDRPARLRPVTVGGADRASRAAAAVPRAGTAATSQGAARRWRLAATAVVLLAWSEPAGAGPPFVTDDPEPTDTGHWEVYNFGYALRAEGDTTGQAGFDINYGGAKDLQLTAVLPIDFQSGEAAGAGDIELAAKYRFLRQAPGALTPDVAFFPRVFLPTAPSRFGPAVVSVLLPVWAQKDFGKWSLFGGGGWDINPGPGNRDFWLTGVGLTRQVSERLTLGAEVFRQTADVDVGKAFTGVNAGAIYRLTHHWWLLVSGGPGIENSRQEDEYDLYISLEATY
jgi:hypothetical protein